MQRVLRVLGWIIGSAALAAALGALYLRAAYPNVPPPTALSVTATPALQARGTYLAEHVAVCIDCHSSRDWTHFAAPVIPESAGGGGERFGHEVGMPGDLIGSNITPHGVGKWSDGELLQAITAGVTPDGRALFPFMNYLTYGKLCRRDQEALVTWVRGLKPITSDHPATKLDFPLNLIVRTMPNAQPVSDSCPDARNSVELGRYLVTTANCIECHTQREGPNLRMELAFGGGQPLAMPGGGVVHSKNITPHEQGIGSWTREAFVARFATYREPTHAVAQGEPNTMMPWTMYAGMTDQDLGAIYDFLRTVKPVAP